jgi:hypothetical protein
MRKWIPVLIVFILVLGGVWFWSLGSMPEQNESVARLAEKQGSVRIVHADGQAIEAEAGSLLNQGDRVITSANGSAILDWFEQGESRLSTSTEIVIQSLGQTEEGSLLLDLRLESGRIWSRLQSLLDIDGSAAIHTSDVIATVRGTSFDLEKHANQPTTLWVSDSVVEASGPATASTADGLLVVEGSMAKFGGPYRTTSTMPISASGTQSEWFIQNREADRNFDTKARAKIRTVLGVRRLPGFLRPLADLSERLRGPSIGGRLLLRRLAIIRDEAESGIPGKAAEDFSRLERELGQQLDSGKPTVVASLRRALFAGRKLYEDVMPDAPAYRYKQALEALQEKAAKNVAERIFLRLLSIQNRLDEGTRALEAGNMELGAQMAGIAEQALMNLSRDLQQVQSEQRVAPKLKAKIRGLSARAAALRARTTIQPVVLPEPATSTNMQIETKAQIFINGKPL